MSSRINISGYNQWSEHYDSYPNPTVAIDELHFPNLYANVKNQKVLEIGCGTGRHTSRLAKQENSVLGIDISKGMLDKARQKINSSRVEFYEKDFISDEIPGAPFDSIVMSLVLEHIKKLDNFFKKSSQVLAACGKMYFSEIHPERSKAGRMAHFRQVDGSDYYLESNPHTEDEIITAATRNKFTIEKVENVLGNKKLSKLNPKWDKYLNQPMIQMWVLGIERGNPK